MDKPRDTVVIDKTNFEVLVQKANTSNDYRLRDIIPPGEIGPLMCLPMDEYEDLLLSQRQYANLTRHLAQEGMTEEHITALSQDELPSVQAGKAKCKVPHPKQKDAPTTLTTPGQPRDDRVLSSDKKASDKQASDKQAAESTGEKSMFLSSGIQPRFKESWRQDVDGLQLPLGNKTTFVLKGLLDSMTYWDITSVIRGGSLSSLRWASDINIAFLSFVEEEAATSFYDHVQKNGLYIQNRKIQVSWAARPYNINGELAAQIRKGASRNLIIRDCEGKLTEQEIREDMEHIDKLVIIKVMFLDGHCHIKTNAISEAIVARTCMQSRRKYKQWVIQWGHDECSEPFDGPQESRSPKQKATSNKKPVARGQNRFASLRKDDNDNNHGTYNGGN
ncbi:hypothetical protein F5Y00DRAFT_274655 [Daldinia vernicosa]|uniref:uncharacterized protein n=1 Tax=Daldinia vernicosa TaxID=114800 RepID=UPI00200836B0|nr:uncharacterized protein F5Y00DRAFT_274655 [Daldinia vernicosa]KAI0851778.1 hypothetical protein F5Y00DRAFT_274655 [Daldinia vernicosa]